MMHPSERTIQHIHLARLEDWPDELEFDGEHFFLFILADWRGRLEDAGALGIEAIRQGMSGVATWGPDSAHAETQFDLAAFDVLGVEAGCGIMSMWFANDTLTDAVWQAYVTGIVDEKFLKSTGTLLCVSVGSTKFQELVAEELQDPLDYEHESPLDSDAELWTQLP